MLLETDAKIVGLFHVLLRVEHEVALNGTVLRKEDLDLDALFVLDELLSA